MDERIKAIMEKRKENEYQALQIALRHEVRAYIREISRLWGGDDPAWLDSYIAEVWDVCKDDMRKAQECFKDLLRQAKELTNNGTRKPMGQAR